MALRAAQRQPQRRRPLFLHRPQRRRVQVVRLPHQSVRTRNVLLEHDAVMEAAIVPSPDPNPDPKPDPLRLAAPKAFISSGAPTPYRLTCILFHL